VAVPGFRLARALDAACEAAGVRCHAGRASSVRVAGGRAAGVAFRRAGDDAEHPLGADAVILATGRFLAGGLEEGPRGVREPLLDLPLFDDRGDRVDGLCPRAAVRPRYLDAQPLFSAGVRVDARLRPLATAEPVPGRDGAVLPGLFAAGDLLGGFDPSRQRTGLGVALVTGRRAAQQALLAAQRSRSAEVR
jgi:glycerol-3-phosphate dehydrogenase subunit B